MKKKNKIAYYMLTMLENSINLIHNGLILIILYTINIILLENLKTMINVVNNGKIHLEKKF